jgi:hypothetical protein
LSVVPGSRVQVDEAGAKFVLRGVRGTIVDDRHSYDGVHFSPDGKRAVTYRRNAQNVVEAAVWDTAVWTPISVERPPQDPHGFPFRPPIFTSDSRYLIVEWMFCDLATGQWSLPEPRFAGDWTLSPDGTKLPAVEGDPVSRVTVRDFQAVLKTLGPP